MGRSLCLAGLCLAASAALAQSGERSLFVAPTQPVAGEARHALVIGNGAYANSPLRNPVNDARAMAKVLGESGFNVMLVENGTQADMRRAIRSFGNRIAQGGIGLFYYAGHGIQRGGRNYLLPVNADIAHEYEIEFASVDMSLVMASMDAAKNGLNIVILDACRNNPFARSFRSVQGGLAQMDAPTGTFIAFATAPGSVASDGSGDNSVYTKYVVAEMQRPSVPIEQMFKQVRNSVMEETKGLQIPWESSSLRGEFAFRGVPGALSSHAEIDRMIRDALDRQRKELEVLGMRPPGTKPVAPLAPPAPPAIAALATPSTLGSPARNAKLPAVGDTWTYRLVEPKTVNGRRERQYEVTIAAVTSYGIMDRYRLQGGPEAQWAHDSRASLVNLSASVFSPYLHILGRLPTGSPFERIQIEDTGCTRDYICDATGNVTGRETLRTPAGSFDTVRVVIEQSWRASQPAHVISSQFAGGRILTIWYSTEAKRAVKFSSRATYGSLPPIEPNFDLELVSYSVKP